MNQKIEPIYLQEPMSACCGADLLPGYNSNVCSKCKEYCDIGYVCDKCQGKGHIGILDDPDEHTTEEISCEYCQGTGQIVVSE